MSRRRRLARPDIHVPYWVLWVLAGALVVQIAYAIWVTVSGCACG